MIENGPLHQDLHETLERSKERGFRIISFVLFEIKSYENPTERRIISGQMSYTSDCNLKFFKTKTRY